MDGFIQMYFNIYAPKIQINRQTYFCVTCIIDWGFARIISILPPEEN